MARNHGVPWLVALVTVGAGLLLWIGYPFLRDSPGICVGAPQAYRDLRGRSLIRGDTAFRRLTLAERIAVYRADYRCGRPSSMSLRTVIAVRDSTVTVEPLDAPARANSVEDTTVVLQLLAREKCDRDFAPGSTR
jgi:hypothetical protein